MISIDFIGLILTVIMAGIRYPHYVLLGSLIHEIGPLLLTIILHGNIENVVAAGAFSSETITNIGGLLGHFMIIFSAPITNYIASRAVGGVCYEKTNNILNPFAKLMHPFAVVNLRIALISAFAISCQELFR